MARSMEGFPWLDLNGRVVTRRQALKALGVAGSTFLAADLIAACQSLSSSSTASKQKAAVVGQPSDFNLTETFIDDQPNWSWKRAVYNTLTEYEVGTVNAKPSLAQSWQYTDSQTLKVKLRQDVKFHSGRPFGPDDVVYSIQAITGPLGGSQLAFIARQIADVAPTGTDEVTFRLKQPMSNLFDLFEMTPIVDKETFANAGSGKQIIGTGPFVFQSWQPGVSMTLKRNASYWKPGRPYLEELDIRVFNQIQAALTALTSGQIHMIVNITPATASTLTSSKVSVVPLKIHDLTFYIGMNLNSPPFDNKLVRQAVAWGIDRNRILQQVFRGNGATTSIPWPKGSPAYDAGLANTYSYDPAKAKQMLQQAGFKSSSRIQFAVPASEPPEVAAAQLVQFDLQQLGFQVDLVQMDDPTYVSKLIGAQLQLWADVHGFGSIHPVSVVGAFPFHATGNPANLKDPAYQELINKCWLATDSDSQKAANLALGQYYVDQQFITDLVATTTLNAVQSNFKGWTTDSMDHVIYDDAQFT